MRIDRWIMSGVGFLYDWGVSRKLRKVWPCFIPLVLLLSVAGLSVWGASRKTTELARWYEKLGEQEIEAWEDSLGQEVPKSDDGSEDSPKISPYAEMLFRRLQAVQPSERSRFIIGITYAQQGAFEQALPIFDKLAPDGTRGYAPAHAFLAIEQMRRVKLGQLKFSPEVQNQLFHHIREAQRWDAVPLGLLVDGANLFFEYARFSDSSFYFRESVELLSRAAERAPELNLELAKRALDAKDFRRYEQAADKALTHFQKLLDEDPNNESVRASVADALCVLKRFEEANKVIRDGLDLRSSEFLTRQLAEVYRLGFVASFVKENGAYVANLELLDRAMQLDPGNPYISQEIAKLVRVSGMRPTEEMIANLQANLASGNSTVLTHAWISQAYLVREDYRRAMPHLEQVATRMPEAPQFSNNLAYVLMELHPDRLDEAAQLAERSVRIAEKRGHRNLPDFLDTLATIYFRQDRLQESIAAYEMAIERNPRKAEFHDRVAEALDKYGDTTMATKHRKFAQKLRDSLQAASADKPEDPEGVEEIDPNPSNAERAP